MKLALAAVAVPALAIAGSAFAACEWEWLCNGEGTCRRMPVCASVDDAPPRLAARPPLVIRTSGDEGPARRGLVCEHVMRRERGGHWSWSEACFCADRARNPDASGPFAHIVRCVPPAAAAGR